MGSKKWRLFEKNVIFFPKFLHRTDFSVRKPKNWVKCRTVTPPNFVLCIQKHPWGLTTRNFRHFTRLLRKKVDFLRKRRHFSQKDVFYGSITTTTSYPRFGQKSEIFRSWRHLRPVLNRGNKLRGGYCFSFRLNRHIRPLLRLRSEVRPQKQVIFWVFWLVFGQLLDPRLSSKSAISLGLGRVRTSQAAENVPPDICELS